MFVLLSFDCCTLLSVAVIALDLVDKGGNRLLNIWKNVTKTDLDVDGKVLKKGALKGLSSCHSWVHFHTPHLSRCPDKFSMEDFFGKNPVTEITKKILPTSLTCLPCYEATSVCSSSLSLHIASSSPSLDLM